MLQALQRHGSKITEDDSSGYSDADRNILNLRKGRFFDALFTHQHRKQQGRTELDAQIVQARMLLLQLERLHPGDMEELPMTSNYYLRVESWGDRRDPCWTIYGRPAESVFECA